MASTDTEGVFVWAWSGTKRAHLYIDLLEYDIGLLEYDIGLLEYDIDLLEYDIDLLEFIIGLPESIGPLECIIGPLECIIGPLECIIGLPESKGPLEYTIGQLEFIIGLPESKGPLEYTIGQLDSRETDHTEVLEVPWSHDMLVAANSHRVTIGKPCPGKKVMGAASIGLPLRADAPSGSTRPSPRPFSAKNH